MNDKASDFFRIGLSAETLKETLSVLNLPKPILDTLIVNLSDVHHSGKSFALAVESVLLSPNVYCKLGLLEDDDVRLLYAAYGKEIITTIIVRVNDTKFTDEASQQLEDTERFMRSGEKSLNGKLTVGCDTTRRAESYSDLVADRKELRRWIESEYARYSAMRQSSEQ